MRGGTSVAICCTVEPESALGKGPGVLVKSASSWLVVPVPGGPSIPCSPRGPRIVRTPVDDEDGNHSSIRLSEFARTDIENGAIRIPITLNETLYVQPVGLPTSVATIVSSKDPSSSRETTIGSGETSTPDRPGNETGPFTSGVKVISPEPGLSLARHRDRLSQ